jgi:hypothetical protein
MKTTNLRRAQSCANYYAMVVGTALAISLFSLVFLAVGGWMLEVTWRLEGMRTTFFTSFLVAVLGLGAQLIIAPSVEPQYPFRTNHRLFKFVPGIALIVGQLAFVVYGLLR